MQINIMPDNYLVISDSKKLRTDQGNVIVSSWVNYDNISIYYYTCTNGTSFRYCVNNAICSAIKSVHVLVCVFCGGNMMKIR